METKQFKAGDGTIIEPTDYRLELSGTLEVPIEEFPDPKAEVTITFKGTAKGLGLKPTGREGHTFWTLGAKIAAHDLVTIEIREPDPTLWDGDDGNDGDDGE